MRFLVVDEGNARRAARSRTEKGLAIVCGTIAAAVALASTAAAQPVDSLRVMTYNILVGGAAYGPLSRTVGVIQTAQADVVGIQEVGGSTQAIANTLGFHYHNFDGDNAIVSRYPITQILDRGVKLQLSPGQEAYIFDVHLAPYPYQPYDIRDGFVTSEAQAIAEAQATRGGSVASLLDGMSPYVASGKPVFLVGDFNEPSHLDWTQEAAGAGLNFGMKVDWPASRAVTNAGLIDAFRELRPDEINDRGETWTPGSPAPFNDPNEVHDRIDFVYYTPAIVEPLEALVLGYDANDGNTDIGIQPYPSDHRAVVVEFDVTACSVFGDLNGSCGITAADWAILRNGQHANLIGLTQNEAWAMGDLNGDYRNDHADFVLFKTAYEAAHGTGSFARMLRVPEPASGTLAMCGVAFVFVSRRRVQSAAARRSNFSISSGTTV
ncbi:MAG: endonuclease/exonuclease/phosphatase family protein [Pirellulales bacterium]